MEKRASIGRAAFGAFLEYKNHVPVMTVLLAMAWSFGCDKEECLTHVEFVGTCRAENPLISGVHYGNRTLDEGDSSAIVEYACATKGIDGRPSLLAGGVECLDPETPFQEWGSADWGMAIYVTLPLEACSCDYKRDECYINFWLFFEDQVDAPKDGAVFDLTQAKLGDGELNITSDSDYKVTGGTIEFISLKSNQYSYKIHNLTLSKIPIGYGESPPHCFNPETIKIDTMSVNCVPTTHDVTTCEW